MRACSRWPTISGAFGRLLVLVNALRYPIRVYYSHFREFVKWAFLDKCQELRLLLRPEHLFNGRQQLVRLERLLQKGIGRHIVLVRREVHRHIQHLFDAR